MIRREQKFLNTDFEWNIITTERFFRRLTMVGSQLENAATPAFGATIR